MRAFELALLSAGALAIGSVANAGVLFTYDDPNALNQEFKVFAPAGPGNPGTIDFDSTQTLRLRIDATEEQGGAIVEVDAHLFFFDMIVGPVSLVGNSLVGISAGAFEFRTAGDDELIIRGEFDDGILLTLFGSGSQQTARNEAGGSLVLTPGQALFDLLDSVGYTLPGIAAGGPSSSAWSLADINEEVNPDTLVNRGTNPNEMYFPTFDADSAFVGRFTVPTPGSVVMVGLAGAMALGFRRR